MVLSWHVAITRIVNILKAISQRRNLYQPVKCVRNVVMNLYSVNHALAQPSSAAAIILNAGISKKSQAAPKKTAKKVVKKTVKKKATEVEAE